MSALTTPAPPPAAATRRLTPLQNEWWAKAYQRAFDATHAWLERRYQKNAALRLGPLHGGEVAHALALNLLLCIPYLAFEKGRVLLLNALARVLPSVETAAVSPEAFDMPRTYPVLHAAFLLTLVVPRRYYPVLAALGFLAVGVAARLFDIITVLAIVTLASATYAIAKPPWPSRPWKLAAVCTLYFGFLNLCQYADQLPDWARWPGSGRAALERVARFGAGFVPLLWYAVYEVSSGRLGWLKLSTYLVLPRLIHGPVFPPGDLRIAWDERRRWQWRGMFSLGTAVLSVAGVGLLERWLAAREAQWASAAGGQLLLLSFCHYLSNCLALVASFNLVVGWARLFGVPIKNVFFFWLLARTPNERWRRWNMLFREWIITYVFYPMMRAKWGVFLAVMTTLLTSGLVHILALLTPERFDPARIGRIMGYWTFNGLAIYVVIMFPNWFPRLVDRLRMRESVVWSVIGILITTGLYSVAMVLRDRTGSWAEALSYVSRLFWGRIVCGIAGILSGPEHGPPSLDELRRMAAMLAHRGPDGQGFYRDQRAGLAHARLSIIDLAGGAQPIHNEDESIWITFNGEIFNYVELRSELERRGHVFYTNSDTEVVVHAYEEYGSDAWRRLNGQFALALWNSTERRLWLVRDRVGILPLFYVRGEGFIGFGSEIKAILAGGRVTPRFSPAGLRQVFSRWATSAPACVFEGIRSVRPGEVVCFDAELRETRSTFWQPDFAERTEMRGAALRDGQDELKQRLTQAIRLRLRADVPVGAYLSGGLDSSVIAWLVRQMGISELETFAIGFDDPAYDETPQQRRMAQLLGTRHHEIRCGANDIRAALPDTVWHCETPLTRTGPVPMFLLSRLVRESGMKVVLTGEGADELLAGYNIFKEDRIRRFCVRQPDSARRPTLLSRLYPYVGQDRNPQQSRLWQEFFRRGMEQTDEPFYSHLIRWRNTSWALRFLSPELRETEAGIGDELVALRPPGWQAWRPLARAQWLEIETFMSAYLLTSQGDRVAMGHSVEARYPYLDPDVIDFCAGLPGRFKLRGLLDKVILRGLAARELPPEVWQRPKHPYRAPIGRVLFNRAAPDYVHELLSRDELQRYGLTDVDPARRLVERAFAQDGAMSGEREEMALVGLLTLQLLARQYLTEFGARVRTQQARFSSSAPAVCVDRCGQAEMPQRRFRRQRATA